MMGLKGNKAGEMSVSNALTALTKSQQVERRGGEPLKVLTSTTPAPHRVESKSRRDARCSCRCCLGRRR
jgi:hypothetical protein